jgi:hypothetical protein
MDAGTVDPPFKLSNYTICHQSSLAKLEDGFRSFPSGHSSRTLLTCSSSTSPADIFYLVSFAGLGFLAFYLAGKLRVFDARGHTVRKVNIAILDILIADMTWSAAQSLAFSYPARRRRPRRHLAHDGLPTYAPPVVSSARA